MFTWFPAAVEFPSSILWFIMMIAMHAVYKASRWTLEHYPMVEVVYVPCK